MTKGVKNLQATDTGPVNLRRRKEAPYELYSVSKTDAPSSS